MKHFKECTLLLIATWFVISVNAQTINWASLQENKHIINANIGMEYGVIYGAGYGYRIKNRLFPIVADIEYSFPSGNKIFDDFKTKIGGRIRWIEYRNFQFSTMIHSVFRRYENDLVRLVNFGSDLSGVIGYYRLKWFVAGEAGFDKAIVTHFKHSQLYKDQYPDVVNGWYEPPTGGNFYYGFQAGYFFKKYDLYLKGGNILTQDFKTKPMLPLYVQVGFDVKF